MSSAWRAAFEADKEARVRAFLAQAPPAAVAAVRFDCESAPALAERLLCARKGAVPAAVALVRTVAAWRRTRGVRALCAAPLADVLGGLAYDELHFLHAKAYFPYPDRRGRPVYVERTGGADADLLAALTSLDVLEAHHIVSMEVDVRNLYALASAAAGAPVTAQTTILDFAGMSLKLANANSRAYVQKMSALDTAAYPETLGRLLIINAPSYFNVAWAMVRGFLDPATVAKISILGGPAEWQPVLRELIDPDRTPTEYGGTLVVPGGLFPAASTQRAQLAAGKTLAVETPAAAAGAAVRIKWLARPGDVKWGVAFRRAGAPAGAPLLELAPTAAFPDCDKKWIAASFVAPEAGAFVSTWNNSAGWYAREILHRVDDLDAGPDGTLRLRRAGMGRYGLITHPAPDGPFSTQAWDALLASRGADDAAQAAVAAMDAAAAEVGGDAADDDAGDVGDGAADAHAPDGGDDDGEGASGGPALAVANDADGEDDGPAAAAGAVDDDGGSDMPQGAGAAPRPA